MKWDVAPVMSVFFAFIPRKWLQYALMARWENSLDRGGRVRFE